jgi:predicted nuclease with TOPRIM domain
MGDGRRVPIMPEEWSIPSKALFDMLTELQHEFADLKTELQQTRADMRAYNGLREQLKTTSEDVDDIKKRLQNLENIAQQNKGRSQVAEGIQKWVPLLFGVAGTIFGIWKGLS